MKRTVVLILFSPVFLAVLSPSATAEVFERDWKTPGDGLLTYDDVNQREWLDLTETQLSKFPVTLQPSEVIFGGSGGSCCVSR